MSADSDKVIKDVWIRAIFGEEERHLWESGQIDQMETLEYSLIAERENLLLEDAELDPEEIAWANWEGSCENRGDGTFGEDSFGDNAVVDREDIRTFLGLCLSCKEEPKKVRCTVCNSCPRHCQCPPESV